MNDEDPDPLPLPIKLALGYAPGAARPAMQALFALDTRLGKLVGQSREPMLAQIRLAWWRDRLGDPVAARPQGDRVLDALGGHWAGHEAALVALVDGWEHLLAEPPLPRSSIEGFAAGRAESWAGLARVLRTGDPQAAYTAGQRWALVDLSARISDPAERETAFAMARENGVRAVSLPRALRPLAVLDGLARRAIARGEPSMAEGRRAMLAVMRLGMFGR